jgi:hypothetical protein
MNEWKKERKEEKEWMNESRKERNTANMHEWVNGRKPKLGVKFRQNLQHKDFPIKQVF